MAKNTIQDKRIIELFEELKSYIEHEKKQIQRFSITNATLYQKLFSVESQDSALFLDYNDPEQQESIRQNIEKMKLESASELEIEGASGVEIEGASESEISEGPYKSKNIYHTLGQVLATHPKMTPQLRALDKVVVGLAKLLAANEVLKALSTEQTFNGRKATVSSLLEDDTFVEIMTRSPDSNTQRALKILSLIGILFGVGIITTAALAAKRLYDTNGRSANFFKPLSASVVLGSMTAVKNLKDVVEQPAPAA